MNLGRDGFIDDLVDQVARDLGGEHLIAVAIDHLALHVHHVIEIQDAFAACVVALFHALLSGFYRAVQPRMFESLALFHAEAFHHLSHAVCSGEVAHEVILEGDEKL